MNRESRFWDRIAERYFKRPIADVPSYKKKLSITQRYLNEDMRVLEFGCGTGGTAIENAPHVKHTLAVDISEKMIDIARTQSAQSGIDNITFEQADFHSKHFKQESFDAILGHSILQLVADRDTIIQKVHCLLKSGGVFVSSTTCLGDKIKVFKLIAPVGRALGIFPLVKVFKVDELVTSMKTAGFAIEYQWKPEKSHAVFIVARKLDNSTKSIEPDIQATSETPVFPDALARS